MLKYYMPVEIVYGSKCLLENYLLLDRFGDKALIVTGRKSAELSGGFNDCLISLKKLGKDYVLYNEISQNPNIECVSKGVEILQYHGCDFIIAIGGGSPIDAAKAISVCSVNAIDPNNIHSTRDLKKQIPLIAVPTTAGTGTEATPYSVINDDKKQKKAGFSSPLMFPVLAYLDPGYTFTMDYQNTRDTGIDALSHLLEGIYSNQRNILNYPLIREGVKLIFDNLKLCLEEPDNFRFRDALMRASLYGGIVIAQSSTTLQHSIGYPLTYNKGYSHGFANGLVMKHIMELYYPRLKNEIDQLFNSIQISKRQFFEWLDDFDFKLKESLNDVFIKKMVDEIVLSRNMALNPLDVSKDEIVKILRKL